MLLFSCVSRHCPSYQLLQLVSSWIKEVPTSLPLVRWSVWTSFLISSQSSCMAERTWLYFNREGKLLMHCKWLVYLSMLLYLSGFVFHSVSNVKSGLHGYILKFIVLRGFWLVWGPDWWLYCTIIVQPSILGFGIIKYSVGFMCNSGFNAHHIAYVECLTGLVSFAIAY